MSLKVTNKIGKLGEDIICKYLENKGFLIEERNFLKKWGEIDVIALKEEKVHFIEVKSVSCENLEDISFYDPLEKVDRNKRKRLGRVIETYLLENELLEDNKAWQIDIATVFIDEVECHIKIKLLRNVAL